MPNPAPIDPTAGTNGVELLISYVKWAVIVFLGICAVASAGMLGAGNFTNRPETAERGKRGLLWSFVGVIAAVIAIPVINNIFGAAS